MAEFDTAKQLEIYGKQLQTCGANVGLYMKNAADRAKDACANAENITTEFRINLVREHLMDARNAIEYMIQHFDRKFAPTEC